MHSNAGTPRGIARGPRARIECGGSITPRVSAPPPGPLSPPPRRSFSLPNPFRCDVLVLGSGIAGLFYALRAAEFGSVAIVTKKRAADSATNWAQGGIAAVQDDDDSFTSHVEDTLVAGDGLCRVEVVERVVERGPAMIDALLKLGADFDVAATGERKP